MKLDKTKKYAFDIPNAKISELVQRRLFELGYGWGYRASGIVQHTEAKSFYLTSGRILKSNSNITTTLGGIGINDYIIIHYSQIIGDNKFLNNFK